MIGAFDDDRPSPGYADSDEVRWVHEPPKRAGRRAFARDRARVLHSAALRRLAAKTQVLVAGELDFPRTRLTHTLEVAQVGRELGEALGADPDLVEVAALCHDLGHPPFGHNGEAVLDDVAAGIGGFEGNAQTLRVLTRLEAKTFAPDGPGDAATDPDQGSMPAPAPGRSVGLNLTRAALDAAGKYPWPRRPGRRKFGVYDDDLAVFGWLRDGAPGERRCLEAQVMDWADDVAYSVHDVEDAVHAGHLELGVLTSPAERADVIAVTRDWYAPTTSEGELLAALDRLLALPWWPGGYDGSQRSLAALKNLTSRLIGRFASAAETSTREAFGGGRLTRYAADLVVPDAVRHEVAVLKGVAARYVMLREGADDVYAEQRSLILELVEALLSRGPDALDAWLRPVGSTWHVDAGTGVAGDAVQLRSVVDQVASLTDTSVVAWHRRLCR